MLQKNSLVFFFHVTALADGKVFCVALFVTPVTNVRVVHQWLTHDTVTVSAQKKRAMFHSAHLGDLNKLSHEGDVEIAQPRRTEFFLSLYSVTIRTLSHL